MFTTRHSDRVFGRVNFSGLICVQYPKFAVVEGINRRAYVIYQMDGIRYEILSGRVFSVNMARHEMFRFLEKLENTPELYNRFLKEN